jgi:hypothetical protein
LGVKHLWILACRTKKQAGGSILKFHGKGEVVATINDSETGNDVIDSELPKDGPLKGLHQRSKERRLAPSAIE